MSKAVLTTISKGRSYASFTGGETETRQVRQLSQVLLVTMGWGGALERGLGFYISLFTHIPEPSGDLFKEIAGLVSVLVDLGKSLGVCIISSSPLPPPPSTPLQLRLWYVTQADSER